MTFFRQIHKVLLALSCMDLPEGCEFRLTEYPSSVHLMFYINQKDDTDPIHISMYNDFIDASRPSRLVAHISTEIKPLTKQNKGGIVERKVK